MITVSVKQQIITKELKKYILFAKNCNFFVNELCEIFPKNWQKFSIRCCMLYIDWEIIKNELQFFFHLCGGQREKKYYYFEICYFSFFQKRKSVLKIIVFCFTIKKRNSSNTSLTLHTIFQHFIKTILSISN